MPDPYALNIERWRQRSRAAVGGVYGEQTAKLQGWDPSPRFALINDYVTLDSDQRATKLHTTSFKEYEVKDEKNIDTGTDLNLQVIGRLDRPINNVRLLNLPMGGMQYANQDEDGTSPATVVGVVFVTLLRVDLNSGIFRLEDLTWDLAHKEVTGIDASTSSLYSDPANFVRFDSVPPLVGTEGFQVYVNDAGATADCLSGGLDTIIAATSQFQDSQTSGSFWFHQSGATDFRKHGNLGPFTGIHLYYNPSTRGGGNPAPNSAGDVAVVKVFLPEPKPGAPALINGRGTDRFPHLIGDEFGILDQ